LVCKANTARYITSILVYFGITNAWFGEAREGIMLFCEHARDGYIKQPANSFSNLAFSIVGLYIAWFVYKNKFQKTNAMSNSFFYPMVLSFSLIILGAGSFAMHASNGFWGGFSDLFGMFLLSSFIFSYALMRWFKLSK
jgi:hypothetical protein